MIQSTTRLHGAVVSQKAAEFASLFLRTIDNRRTLAVSLPEQSGLLQEILLHPWFTEEVCRVANRRRSLAGSGVALKDLRDSLTSEFVFAIDRSSRPRKRVANAAAVLRTVSRVLDNRARHLFPRLFRPKAVRSVHNGLVRHEPLEPDHPTLTNLCVRREDGQSNSDIALLSEAITLHLTPEEQRAVYLRFWAGENYTSIAESLGVTPAECRRRIGDAVAKLRQHLEVA